MLQIFTSHVQQVVVHIHSHTNPASSSPHLHLLSLDLYQVTCISHQPCRSMFDATWHQGQSVSYKCPSRLVPVKIRLRRRWVFHFLIHRRRCVLKKKKTLCHGNVWWIHFSRLYSKFSPKCSFEVSKPPNPNPHLPRWPHRLRISWWWQCQCNAHKTAQHLGSMSASGGKSLHLIVPGHSWRQPQTSG